MKPVRSIMLPVAEGDLIAGRYRVVELLGTGTTGVVVRAEDLDAREVSHAGARASRPEAEPRYVAVKLLWPHLAATDDGVVRFFKEQETAQRLAGEHIPRVLDAGVHVRVGGAPTGPLSSRGVPFFVMELVIGCDLTQVLRDEMDAGHIGLAPSDVVEIGMQVVEGLSEAHAMGIIHRDIKPSNLFLTTRADGTGLVKILDFGMSKGASRDDMLPLGSPAYAAPEQVRGASEPDARSDIWSLGIVLYELLAGRLPFRADGVAGLLVAVMTQEPDPLHGVDAELEEVVLRCIARDADARFETVADLAEALAPFGRPDAPARAAAVRRRIAAAATPAPPPAWPTRAKARPSLIDDVGSEETQTRSVAPVALDSAEASADNLRAMRPRRMPAVAMAVALAGVMGAGALYGLEVSPSEIAVWAREAAARGAHRVATDPPLGARGAAVAPPPLPAAPVPAAAPVVDAGLSLGDPAPARKEGDALAPPDGQTPRPPPTYAPVYVKARPQARGQVPKHRAAKRQENGDDLRKFLDQRK